MAIRTLFFGTPHFAVPILEMLCTHPSLEMVGVVAQPDKPVGRKQILTPPPTKVVAQKYQLPVYQPNSLRTEEAYQAIANFNADLIIVAAYGKIVPANILALPKYQCLNVHPSALPKYRGASPLQYTVWHNEQETKTTIMVMETTLDTGPIVAQSDSYQLAPNETYLSLEEKLSHASANLLNRVIDPWCKSEIVPQKQDDQVASYTKILTKEDGKIDWQQSAQSIDCQIRALNPWPSTYTFIDQKRLKLLKTNVLANKSQALPGTLIIENQVLQVVCGDQQLLQITTLQLEGKSVMSDKEFIAGYQQLSQSVLV